MFDLRYHAISLVAVFLALAIGILLGVTIGDSLVSQADRGLRESLREDVVSARDAEQRAETGLERREELIAEIAPTLIDRGLQNESVAVVGVGPLPEGFEAAVRSTITSAGGSLDSVSTLPIEPDELRELLPSRASDLSDSALAERLARTVVEGGEPAARLRDEDPSTFMGAFDGADAVIFHGVPPEEEGAERAQPWEAALIGGLLDSGARVVGAEQTPKPKAELDEGEGPASQAPFFADQGIPSVDNIETAGGAIALVYALAGADGRFGYGDDADAVLPPAPRVVR